MSPYENEAFFHQLLAKAVAAGASDIHVKVGQPPGARVRGEMVYFRVDKVGPADAEAVARHLVRGASTPCELESVRELEARALPGQRLPATRKLCRRPTRYSLSNSELRAPRRGGRLPRFG